MDAITLSAIQNTLVSANIDMNTRETITASNVLPFSISAFIVWSDGSSTWAGLDVAGGQTVQSAVTMPDKWYLVWRETVSNAFVCVQFVDFSVSTTYTVTQSNVQNPGDIGPVPQPNKNVIIPQDTARIIVAGGRVAGGTIIRYQYWHSTSDSYTLPPGDTRTYSVTTVEGMTSTSSDSTTVSSAMSSSASAGWGPVSASISYSLSSSSTSMHSYTVFEQTTRFETVTLQNTSSNIVTYVAWQLMDIIEIYLDVNSVLVPSATISSARVPLIYDGPYNPADLPAPPAERTGLRAEEQAALIEWNFQRPVRPTVSDAHA